MNRPVYSGEVKAHFISPHRLTMILTEARSAGKYWGAASNDQGTLSLSTGDGAGGAAPVSPSGGVTYLAGACPLGLVSVSSTAARYRFLNSRKKQEDITLAELDFILRDKDCDGNYVNVVSFDVTDYANRGDIESSVGTMGITVSLDSIRDITGVRGNTSFERMSDEDTSSVKNTANDVQLYSHVFVTRDFEVTLSNGDKTIKNLVIFRGIVVGTDSDDGDNKSISLSCLDSGYRIAAYRSPSSGPGFSDSKHVDRKLDSTTCSHNAIASNEDCLYSTATQAASNGLSFISNTETRTSSWQVRSPSEFINPKREFGDYSPVPLIRADGIFTFSKSNALCGDEVEEDYPRGGFIYVAEDPWRTPVIDTSGGTGSFPGDIGPYGTQPDYTYRGTWQTTLFDRGSTYGGARFLGAVTRDANDNFTIFSNSLSASTSNDYLLVLDNIALLPDAEQYVLMGPGASSSDGTVIPVSSVPGHPNSGESVLPAFEKHDVGAFYGCYSSDSLKAADATHNCVNGATVEINNSTRNVAGYNFYGFSEIMFGMPYISEASFAGGISGTGWSVVNASDAPWASTMGFLFVPNRETNQNSETLHSPTRGCLNTVRRRWVVDTTNNASIYDTAPFIRDRTMNPISSFYANILYGANCSDDRMSEIEGKQGGISVDQTRGLWALSCSARQQDKVEKDKCNLPFPCFINETHNDWVIKDTKCSSVRATHHARACPYHVVDTASCVTPLGAGVGDFYSRSLSHPTGWTTLNDSASDRSYAGVGAGGVNGAQFAHSNQGGNCLAGADSSAARAGVSYAAYFSGSTDTSTDVGSILHKGLTGERAFGGAEYKTGRAMDMTNLMVMDNQYTANVILNTVKVASNATDSTQRGTGDLEIRAPGDKTFSAWSGDSTLGVKTNYFKYYYLNGNIASIMEELKSKNTAPPNLFLNYDIRTNKIRLDTKIQHGDGGADWLIANRLDGTVNDMSNMIIAREGEKLTPFVRVYYNERFSDYLTDQVFINPSLYMCVTETATCPRSKCLQNRSAWDETKDGNALWDSKGGALRKGYSAVDVAVGSNVYGGMIFQAGRAVAPAAIKHHGTDMRNNYERAAPTAARGSGSLLACSTASEWRVPNQAGFSNIATYRHAWYLKPSYFGQGLMSTRWSDKGDTVSYNPMMDTDNCDCPDNPSSNGAGVPTYRGSDGAGFVLWEYQSCAAGVAGCHDDRLYKIKRHKDMFIDKCTVGTYRGTNGAECTGTIDTIKKRDLLISDLVYTGQAVLGANASSWIMTLGHWANNFIPPKWHDLYVKPGRKGLFHSMYNGTAGCWWKWDGLGFLCGGNNGSRGIDLADCMEKAWPIMAFPANTQELSQLMAAIYHVGDTSKKSSDSAGWGWGQTVNGAALSFEVMGTKHTFKEANSPPTSAEEVYVYDASSDWNLASGAPNDGRGLSFNQDMIDSLESISPELAFSTGEYGVKDSAIQGHHGWAPSAAEGKRGLNLTNFPPSGIELSADAEDIPDKEWGGYVIVVRSLPAINSRQDTN